MEKKKLREGFSRVLLLYIVPILLSGVVRALGIHIFVTPNNFAPGGINGIAVMLEYGTGLNSGWYLLMINVPLFFIAFFLLGKREAIVSTCSMLLTSGLLILFGHLKIPAFDGLATEEPVAFGLLAAVASGILLGAALAIMLRSVGTAGGTAVLASVVNKKWQYLSISWLTFGFDATVVIASFFVYYVPAAGLAQNLVTVLLALVSLFVTSKTCTASTRHTSSRSSRRSPRKSHARSWNARTTASRSSMRRACIPTPIRACSSASSASARSPSSSASSSAIPIRSPTSLPPRRSTEDSQNSRKPCMQPAPFLRRGLLFF